MGALRPGTRPTSVRLAALGRQPRLLSADAGRADLLWLLRLLAAALDLHLLRSPSASFALRPSSVRLVGVLRLQHVAQLALVLLCLLLGFLLGVLLCLLGDQPPLWIFLTESSVVQGVGVSVVMQTSCGASAAPLKAVV